jgi:hypothetical protein
MEAKGRMIMSAKSVEIIPASGTETLIPLNKLKKSPNNARKTPHSEVAVNRPVNLTPHRRPILTPSCAAV